MRSLHPKHAGSIDSERCGPRVLDVVSLFPLTIMPALLRVLVGNSNPNFSVEPKGEWGSFVQI